MRRLTYQLLSAVALIGGLPSVAAAEILQFDIAGEILDDPTDPDGDFPEINKGDRFTGFFRYDADTPELTGGTDPNFGSYLLAPPFVPLSITVEGTTFEANASFPPGVSVVNDYDDVDFGLSDQLSIFDQFPRWPEGFEGLPIELGLSLVTTDTSVLPDVGLPTQFTLDDWENSIVFFGAESSQTGQFLEFLGMIDQLQAVDYVPPVLQAGDADQDLDFDQFDLIQVQQRAKYLTGQAATWGDGDWDGAPGGSAGAPPTGDGLFDTKDIVAALQNNVYLIGPYVALAAGGQQGDGQTSIGYDAGTGHVWVDAPAGVDLTSVNIDSVQGIFTGNRAANLGGSFDHDADDNIFKATFGSSFGSLSFGNVAQPGLDEQSVRNDLSVVGSLAGGGSLGEVDLIYVAAPEPGAGLLASIGLLCLAGFRVGRRAAVKVE